VLDGAPEIPFHLPVDGVAPRRPRLQHTALIVNRGVIADY
jgi:hypothetical protein